MYKLLKLLHSEYYFQIQVEWVSLSLSLGFVTYVSVLVFDSFPPISVLEKRGHWNKNMRTIYHVISMKKINARLKYFKWGKIVFWRRSNIIRNRSYTTLQQIYCTTTSFTMFGLPPKSTATKRNIRLVEVTSTARKPQDVSLSIQSSKFRGSWAWVWKWRTSSG